MNEKLPKADVIILLNGLTDRVPFAAELYQLGCSGNVVLSGDDKNMTQQALSLGIPGSALLLEDQSKTTFENAKYSLKIVQDKGYKLAIVVTSAYHTRRAGIIFAQISKGIHLTICAVPYSHDLQMLLWGFLNLIFEPLVNCILDQANMCVVRSNNIVLDFT
jgi:uncharacterized SAM-binding protein YcdF (DUF218 family)